GEPDAERADGAAGERRDGREPGDFAGELAHPPGGAGGAAPHAGERVAVALALHLVDLALQTLDLAFGLPETLPGALRIADDADRQDCRLVRHGQPFRFACSASTLTAVAIVSSVS